MHPPSARVRRVLLRNEPQQCRPCSLVQAVQSAALREDHAAAPLLQSPARRAPPASRKKKNKAGHLATRRDANQSSTGATSSTREAICGLLSPKGQAHTPPGNLWLYKNAGSLCYECLSPRPVRRPPTQHKAQLTGDARVAGGIVGLALVAANRIFLAGELAFGDQVELIYSRWRRRWV